MHNHSWCLSGIMSPNITYAILLYEASQNKASLVS
ncbi:MAG: hypothetical protein QG588_1314 [Candidatus Poribacteria bacterium]|nr:hypothetical protein [Candidatus Poribacteria bacterium]